MLSPKKVKYRKPQKGKNRGMSMRGNYVAYGSYGMKALESGWISSRQIEASRVSISRRVRKLGKMWIRIFPHKSITKKPAETRMGKGKGAPEYWVSVIKPGRILFEVDGMTFEQAKETFRACSHKLNIKTKVVAKRNLGN
jgi:large subunit ribosomal protein L16